MSTETTLAPCPFCGGATFTRISAHAVRVHCQDCDGVGPRGSCEIAAAQLWNRRAALSTPASTGEGEVERLKADLKDEINFDLNTRVNKVPESVVDQVVDLLAERGVLTIAALPPSSGQSSGISGELNPSSGWEPIETAPRDGTRILIEVPGHEHPVVIGWQDPDFTNLTDDAGNFYPNATLWQPLPPPPSSEGA